MKVRVFKEYNSLSKHAASIVFNDIINKPDLLLCAASGSSPLGLYLKLAEQSQNNEEPFLKLQIIKLDEWVGLEKNNNASCEYYLRKHLIQTLSISEERYYGFNPETTDPEIECQRIRSFFIQSNPIDLCILGLGKNGHIGFNEPANFLSPFAHVAKLSSQSQEHSMIATTASKPMHGMTLGMNDILSSKKIILIVQGDDKELAKNQLFSEKISTACPASFLWLHDNTECLLLE